MVNLREARAALHAQGLATPVLLAADVGVVITDASPGYPIVWVNPAFTRITGYGESVIGRGPRLLAGPGTDPAAVDEIRAALAVGASHTTTLLNYRADGSPFWNRVTISPVRDDDGVLTHWVGIQADVSGEVMAREEERARQEASLAYERRARAGLTVIAQVSELLTDMDDPYLLQQITSLLQHETVSWCDFFLDDGDGLHRTAGLTVEPSGTRRRSQVGPPGGVERRRAPQAGPDRWEGSPLTSAALDPVQDVLEGRATMLAEFDLRRRYHPGSASAWLAAQVEASLTQVDPATHAVLVLPVRGRRRVLGLLVAAAQSFDTSAVTVLDLVAQRVGMAVENVRLYDEEHRLAETLQRAMLPELAVIPGLDVWTYYAPNAEHAQVGGDWYDVLEIDDGVAAVVVGDVVGHDVEAAATMGQLRSVTRAYAVELARPNVVLDRVDDLVAGMPMPRAASMIYATLQLDTGELAYCRAGHLPILLVRDGQVETLMDPPGPLIGFATEARAAGRRQLEPGDVLLFYTDGLIERRGRPLRAGLDALRDAARRVTAIDAAGIGEDLLARLADAPDDDVALVVVRVPDPEQDAAVDHSSPRQRRWVLASEPASISRARQLVVRACRTWGLAEAANAELVVSELVANAVLHGWGHVALQLLDTGDALRIEVEDANPAPPVTTSGHPGHIGGYGMQIVERLADWGWWPSRGGKVVWAKVHRAGEPPHAGRRGT